MPTLQKGRSGLWARCGGYRPDRGRKSSTLPAHRKLKVLGSVEFVFALISIIWP